MKYSVLQSCESDCGFAVLKVLLANLHKNKDFLFLDNKKKNNLSMLDIKKIAKEYNVDLQGYETNNLSDLSTQNLPIICLIKIDKHFHYILLTSITKNKYEIFDPSIGELSLEEDIFQSVFCGNILVVEDVGNIKFKASKKPMNKELIIATSMNLFASLSFFLSFLFLNNIINFVLLTILGVMFLWLQKTYSFKFIETTNNRLNLNYNNLVIVNKYEQNIIQNIIIIPTHIITFFGLLFLFITSLEKGYIFFVLVTILSFGFFLITNGTNKEKNRIEFLENIKWNIDETLKASKRFGNVILFQKIALIIVNILLCLLQMITKNLIGVDYIVFQFTLNALTYFTITKILLIDDKISFIKSNNL